MGSNNFRPSRGPPAVGTVGTTSTKGFYHSDLPPILLTTCLCPELTSEGPVSPAISFNEAPLSFNEAALELVREEDEEDASK